MLQSNYKKIIGRFPIFSHSSSTNYLVPSMSNRKWDSCKKGGREVSLKATQEGNTTMKKGKKKEKKPRKRHAKKWISFTRSS